MGSEKKLPRCLERYTVVETLPNEFYKLVDDKKDEFEIELEKILILSTV